MEMLLHARSGTTAPHYPTGRSRPTRRVGRERRGHLHASFRGVQVPSMRTPVLLVTAVLSARTGGGV